jgi:hypothetical protein
LIRNYVLNWGLILHGSLLHPLGNLFYSFPKEQTFLESSSCFFFNASTCRTTRSKGLFHYHCLGSFKWKLRQGFCYHISLKNFESPVNYTGFITLEKPYSQIFWKYALHLRRFEQLC